MIDPDTLREGDLEVEGLLPWASNYTLLAKIVRTDEVLPVVYKPRRGETPLWDFPEGTLCNREVAAFEVARAADWDFVPPTVLRDGPLGPGAVQPFIPHDPSVTAFELFESRGGELRKIVIFDAITNNADRKAGHVFADGQGRLWAVDHGLCFHPDPKLRTVLWHFVGEAIGEEELAALGKLASAMRGSLQTQLRALLTGVEVQTLSDRVSELTSSGVFPPPGPGRPYPWPPV